MGFSLKNHPFAVDAFFEQSVVLTYAVPKAQLQPYIAPCLSLDTYLDTWAFIAVAMVQTNSLRPRGFPRFLGRDFFLAGYRLFVTYTTRSGKRLRGLYILKSETDKHSMVLLGNTFTHYNYQLIDVERTQTGAGWRVQSQKSGFDVAFRLPDPATDSSALPLPAASPFQDWKTARRYAGPLPFTFTYDAVTQEVLVIEGVRENWTPAPISVVQHRVPFLEELGLETPILASAFMVQNIPYSWKKGWTEQWTGN